MSTSRLPRLSSKAFEHLKLEAAEPESEPTNLPQSLSAASQLFEFVQKIKDRDEKNILSSSSSGGPGSGDTAALFSLLEADVQEGKAGSQGVTESFRGICATAISALFHTDRRLAQETSELLDFGNALLQELEPANGTLSHKAGGAHPSPQRAQQLPEETFFLPPARLKHCLGFRVDAVLAAQCGRARRQAQPPKEIYRAGRRDEERKRGRGRGPGKRKNGAHGQGQSTGRKKGRRSPLDPWTPELQLEVAGVLEEAMKAEGQPRNFANLSQEMREFAESMMSAEATEQMRGMGVQLGQPCATLRVGGYLEPEELMVDVGEECQAAAEAFATQQNPGVRRGKILGSAEAFVSLLAASMEVLLSAARAALVASGAGRLVNNEDVEDVYIGGDLPPSIVANREPFKHGDWRKDPFVPRPYVRLTEYDIVEPAMRSVIKAKLTTRKRGGCGGQHCSSREELGCYSIEQEGFISKCSCLKRNTECDASCSCHATGACLNRAVSQRRTLRLGEDVREINSWGIDCYTRRNIHDAVLESQALGSYRSPHRTALPPSPAEAAVAASDPSNEGGESGSVVPGGQPEGPTQREPGVEEQMQRLEEQQRLHVQQQLQQLRSRHQMQRAQQAQQVRQSVQMQQAQQAQQMQAQGLPMQMQLMFQQQMLVSQQQQAQQLEHRLHQQQEQQEQQLLTQLQHQQDLEQQRLRAELLEQQAQRAAARRGLLSVTSPVTAAAMEQRAQQAELAQQSPTGRGAIAAGGGASSLEQRVTDWIERVLLPAVNRQGDSGWDILEALAAVKRESKAAGDKASFQAASAVESRVQQVGYNYFRVHPKGVGLICEREGGLPALTFVEEYLGEIHTPWRWFEIQDAVKRITGDELPDFYNILLERPKDDPDGYDVLYIDAAAKGAFASRMSHSCTPNCQAVVMACNGRLTIALYTLRHVYPGEELTFDYASVTESEKEFKEAICLCSTHLCRGSYLTFTGSRAFMQVMSSRHNFLHRQTLIGRAGCEPLTERDTQRLKAHGLGAACLGGGDHGPMLPDWLHKWAALVCEFMEEEEACLQKELLAHPLGIYNEASAAIEARGVVSNRLQNVVVTLDKVKMVLGREGQPQGPCLRMLKEQEVVEHLWAGPKSVARRVVRGVAQAVLLAAQSRALVDAATDAEWEAAVAAAAAEMPPTLLGMCRLLLQPMGSPQEARDGLQRLVDWVRELDTSRGGGLTACADILQLYASTKRWLTAERRYKAVQSPPVPLNLEDLTLDRTKAAGAQQAQQGEASEGGQGSGGQLEAAGGGGGPESGAGEGGWLKRERVPSRASVASLGESGGGGEDRGDTPGAAGGPSGLRKTYRPLYVWGQLSGWFKQTVNDPTASLSAERRGTLSLPDIESCFGGKGKYGAKERGDLLEHLERRPDAMWRIGTQWSFRNEAKVYGSPMLDGVWDEMAGEPAGAMLHVLSVLREADVPFKQQGCSEGGEGGGRGPRKKGRGG